ncbi:SusC/RagA family TonB-linked outer membrane protein [Parabacteroides sp. PF5-6]|uniref:SusC/RagA family TonB-linked outer membrane protein n=1 Tax=Parabacteroides sp. PF5-6 TaxID=1742403 RepID=UPI0024057401|nr:SusC/RagA family TonB-linked outer membrane protein [Parabacteroides sp. PF5-6]MDF9828920.1 TonB-linked SusC/RagA family outer membrane protein [Parabacteroides sp. PF5-6]
MTAQTTRVTGTITSAEDNEPVIGASIMVKGAAIGTVTDFNGAFSLDVPADAKVLVVSYVGMASQEVAVRSVVNVMLQTDTQALDEVVVTAMGISREKKSLGYAVQEVKSEELTQAGQLSLTGSLTGKVAGVQVNQFSGTVGASSRISIRGNSSLAADQQPLIIVDGVPFSNASQRTGDNYYNGVDYGSGLNDLNPEDIESMTVLKGGSAALYGMRAGNGVILITTKSGKKGSGVTISYDGNFTVDRISTVPKLQNSYGQGSAGDEHHWQMHGPDLTYQQYAETYGFNWLDGANGVNDYYDESWGPRLDVGLKLKQYDSNGVATDWISRPNNIKDFFQTGYSMNHTISVQANSEKASTRASLSYRDQRGTVPNTDQKRYGGQLNTNIKLNDYVSFDGNMNYTRTESGNLLGQGYGGNNPINSLFAWSARQINMKTLKENWDQRDAAGNYTYYNWNNNYHMNPYFTVHENTNSLKRDRFFGKASLYYQPFEFLKFEGRLGFDHYNAQSFERHYVDRSDWPDGGFLQRTIKNSELNADFIATFNKTFGDFNISAMAGANYRDLQWETNDLGASALTVLGVYTLTNKSGDATATMDHSHIRSNSVYASGSVGWRNQLYLDLSARNDWSSTIKDNFFYPSVSLSWIATESFPSIKGDVLSFLKLRGGWAEIGSATSAYRNSAYYYAVSTSYNGVSQMYKSATYPNSNLKPESIKTWEVGLDVGFFNDRLHADVAYYYKSTQDQIMSVSTSNVVGFGSMLINAGEIENRGIEVQLRGEILQNKSGLNWTSTLNFSKDKSKIVSLYPGLDTYSMGWTWGISNFAKVGEPWGTLTATAFDRTEDGAIKLSTTGQAMTKSGQPIGNVSPDFLAGWRNDFRIKDWAFGFFLDMRIGGDIWSQTMSHGYAAGTAKTTAENGIREHAIVAGKDMMTDERFVMQDASGNWVENTMETTAQDWFGWQYSASEAYVFDGSYLKLREAYVSYNVPRSILAKTKYFSKATVSVIGSNLALLWVHKSNTMRLDPETGGVSSDSRGVGFEQSAVPSSRSIGLKLGLTF